MNNPFKPKYTHDHNWELVSKTYGPPRHNVETTNVSIASFDRALFGLTTLLWKCTACAEFKKEELLGSDVDTLEELMVKADEYGPQYIQQGDKTFVVMRYVAQ